jgi:hypothetical protein
MIVYILLYFRCKNKGEDIQILEIKNIGNKLTCLLLQCQQLPKQIEHFASQM